MSVYTDYTGLNPVTPSSSSATRNNGVEKLSDRLSANTRILHFSLEQTDFGNRWSVGNVSGTEYVMYLADIYRIYSELEKQLVSNGHNDMLEALCIKELFRTDALKKDMEYFNVPVGAAGCASREYEQRLLSISFNAPHKLIAHAWARFMGDLHGGQIAKERLINRWPQGIAFYNYDELLKKYNIPMPSRFVMSFKNLLNSLNLTENEKFEILDEAKWAFEQHIKIFDELSHPTKARFVYAYAVPVLIYCEPSKLLNFLPDGMKVWRIWRN